MDRPATDPRGLPALQRRARDGLVPRGRRLLGRRVHGVPHPDGRVAHPRSPRCRAGGQAPDHLEQVAAERYGDEGFYIDGERRRIPDHWHAHARPAGGFFDPASDLYGKY